MKKKVEEKCLLKNPIIGSVFGVVNFILLVFVVVVWFMKYTSIKNNEIAFIDSQVLGSENVKVFLKYFNSNEYKVQQRSQIEWLKKAMAQDWVQTLSKSDLDSIKNIKTEWKKNTRYVVLEYSELLCPFCKRQHNNWTLSKLMEKYPKDLNISFRHFIVHAPARKYALWAECVNKMKWKNDFFKYIDVAFKSWMNDDTMDSIVSDMWIDSDKFSYCIENDKDVQNIVDVESEEWRKLFWISWTPWSVILDRKTWKYVVIAWAYPLDKFISSFEKLKNSK